MRKEKIKFVQVYGKTVGYVKKIKGLESYYATVTYDEIGTIGKFSSEAAAEGAIIGAVTVALR